MKYKLGIGHKNVVPGFFVSFIGVLINFYFVVKYKKWGKYTPKLRNNKSLAGSFGCFFFATLAMVVVCLLLGFELNIWKFMVLALAATIVELLGDKYDNLLIGLTVAIIGTVLRV